MIFHHTSQTYH